MSLIVRYYDELYHWGLKKNHKYIAKIKISSGKYRYFYDRDEYDAYLNKKKRKMVIEATKNHRQCNLYQSFRRKLYRDYRRALLQ